MLDCDKIFENAAPEPENEDSVKQELSKLVKKSARKGRGPSLVNRVKKLENTDIKTNPKKLQDILNKVLPEDIEID